MTNTLTTEFVSTEIFIWVRTFQNEEGETSCDAEVASAHLWGRRADGTGQELKTLIDKAVNPDDFGFCEGDGEWTEIMERQVLELNLAPDALDLNTLEIEASPESYAKATLNGENHEFDDGNGSCWGETYTF